MQKNRLIFYDVFKAIAILTMILDHVGFYFFPYVDIYRAVGRIAAPIFFFLVGYSRSVKIDKNILTAAILLQILYLIINPEFQALNVLFTITILRFFNKYFKLLKDFLLPILFVIVAYTVLFSQYYVEFGTIAILFSLLGYYVREKRNIYFLYFLTASIITLHIIMQQSSFHFETENLAILIGCLTILGISFIHFEKFNYKILDKKTIRIIAQYALIIYFLHKALFEISAFLITDMSTALPSMYLEDEIIIEKDLLQPNISF